MDAQQAVVTLFDRIRPTLIRWERLRLAYNAILVGFCLTYVGCFAPTLFSSPSFWGVALGGAIVANVCFCAGPTFDAYLYWIGVGRTANTAAIFAVGAFFAVYLSYVVLSALALGPKAN
jgi:hypothetical protein